MIEKPDDPGSPLTILRTATFPPGESAPDAAGPVRYEFADEDPGEGVYEYYVAAFDDESQIEAEPSGSILIDIASGETNRAPIALLTVTPDFGGAPVEVTLDASGSIDIDGEIVEYRFDFDGDGITDYSTTDPEPPAESSTGIATDITPGADPWLVTATYNEGNADWLYPTVRVVDDKGAGSLPQADRLGVSGWETEIITSNDVTTVGFEIRAMGFDPATGEIVVAGAHKTEFPYSPLDKGVYFARLTAGGGWITEQVIDYDAPEWHYAEDEDYGHVASCFIGWNAGGQPIVVMTATKQVVFDSVHRIFCAERTPAGTWELVTGSDGSGSPDIFPRFASFSRAASISPTHFAISCADYQEYSGGYCLLWYEDGVWVIEDTGYKWRQGYLGWHPAFDSNETVHFLVSDINTNPQSIWLYSREGAGNWIEERIDNGELGEGSLGITPNGLAFSSLDEPQVLITRAFAKDDPYIRKISLLTFTQDGIEEVRIGQTDGTLTTRMTADAKGISVFYEDRPGDGINQIFLHERIEASTRIAETIYILPESAGDASRVIFVSATDNTGHAYAIVSGYGGEFGTKGQVFASRVDPRIE